MPSLRHMGSTVRRFCTPCFCLLVFLEESGAGEGGEEGWGDGERGEGGVEERVWFSKSYRALSSVASGPTIRGGVRGVCSCLCTSVMYWLAASLLLEIVTDDRCCETFLHVSHQRRCRCVSQLVRWLARSPIVATVAPADRRSHVIGQRKNFPRT